MKISLYIKQLKDHFSQHEHDRNGPRNTISIDLSIFHDTVLQSSKITAKLEYVLEAQMWVTKAGRAGFAGYLQREAQDQLKMGAQKGVTVEQLEQRVKKSYFPRTRALKLCSQMEH